jgi:hypothetical protein
MLVQIKNSKKKTNKAKIEREATVRMMCLSPVTSPVARQPNNQNACRVPTRLVEK